MKGQVKKLGKEPEVSRECDSVIKEQLASGVIERVLEPGKTDEVHYIPHLAVISKEASTTKQTVMYNASAKSGKESV